MAPNAADDEPDQRKKVIKSNFLYKKGQVNNTNS